MRAAGHLEHTHEKRREEKRGEEKKRKQSHCQLQNVTNVVINPLHVSIIR
jgi:hypothetical protein